MQDVVKFFKIQDIDLLEKLFLFLTDNIGNLSSLNALVRKLKSTGVTSNTVTLGNYIQYLSSTFLIHGVSRYDVKGKKILDGERKYYLNDLGYRNYLSSQFDVGLNKQLENYVYLCLRRAGYDVYVGRIGSLEIDFVAERGSSKLYFQVTYLLTSEEIVEREYRSLEATPNHFQKIVISMDEVQLNPRNGIQHLRAWELESYLKTAKL